jgi:hypothetical protein
MFEPSDEGSSVNGFWERLRDETSANTPRFSYPMRSLSSLCVACIIVYLLLYKTCLCKKKGGGGLGLVCLKKIYIYVSIFPPTE